MANISLYLDMQESSTKRSTYQLADKWGCSVTSSVNHADVIIRHPSPTHSHFVIQATTRENSMETPLPLHAENLLDALMTVTKTHAAETGSPHSTRMLPVPKLVGHVLVAEDNPINQRLVTLLLEKQNMTCDCVGDGNEAIDAWKHFRYDAILMDCKMPQRDGYAATRAIREAELALDRPRVPIIALTASALKGERERCLEAGMDDFLAKPVNAGELFQRLAKLILPTETENNARLHANRRDSTGMADVDASLIETNYFANLLAEIDHNYELIDELWTLFKTDALAICDELNQAAESADYELIEKLAHRLAGSAGNLACENLRQHCAQIEKDAHAQQDSAITNIASTKALLDTSSRAWHAHLQSCK